GLLTRLVYLSIGLGLILGFIGVRLVLDALDDNSLPCLNGGQPLDSVPTVGIELSLAVIVAVLLVTAAASMVTTSRRRRDGQSARTPALASARPARLLSPPRLAERGRRSAEGSLPRRER